MIPKKRKRKKRPLDEIILTFLLLILNLLVIGFLVVGNWKLYVKGTNIKAQLIDLGKEARILESRNQELEKLFFEASQKEYLEKIIREKGQYKKPGEEVVVVLKEKGALTQDQLGQDALKNQSAFQRFINYLKNFFKF
jgi:cell division protein FtsB